MTHLALSRDDEYTVMQTNTNAASASFKQEMKSGDIGAEYQVVINPHHQLPSHPQPEAMENINEIPCLPEHRQQAPAMDLPPVPQDGGEKDPDEDI